MTRSICDKSFNLIRQAYINEYDLETFNSIVLASDGFTDVVKNSEFFYRFLENFKEIKKDKM